MSRGPARIVLAAGGTDGHVYPALAVAELIRARGLGDPLFVTTALRREVALIERAGFVAEVIPGTPWQNESLPGRAKACAAALRGFAHARSVLRRHRAEAVIGFGGYATVGAILAARTLGIWTAIVEPNAEIGMANRLLARVVNRLYVGMSTRVAPHFGYRALRTGIPLREAITHAHGEQPPFDRPRRVLVLADPSHSDFLDRHAPEVLRLVAAHGVPIEVLHQSDRQANVHYQAPHAETKPYIDDIGPVYRWADFVIARAGAGTLAELALSSLPALLVPLSSAAENHQSKNALAYASEGAALVVEETVWDDEQVAEKVVAILTDPSKWHAMTARAQERATPRSAAALLSDVESCIPR